MPRNKSEFEKFHQVLSKVEPLRILNKDSLRIKRDSAGRRSRLGSSVCSCVYGEVGGEGVCMESNLNCI